MHFGDLNRAINCSGADDKIIITNNANQKISLGNGDNKLDIGNDANKKITAGNGDDVIYIGNNANDKIDLGHGNNILEINNDANKKITAGNGDDSIKINGNSNSSITLNEGNDSLHIGGDSNGKLDLGNGNDNVLIEGNVNNSVDLGKGDDFLEIKGDSNGRIDMGSGDDHVLINGDVNQTLNLGKGNDSLVVNGKINADIIGGCGKDSIVLNNYTYDDYINNVDDIQNSLEGFEAIKFSDGTVIGDETLFEEYNTYSYELKVTAKVTDIDSENIDSIKIDASTLPEGVKLFDENGNELELIDGYYVLEIDENSKYIDESITIVSTRPLSEEELKKIEVTATSKEENGGDEESIIKQPILEDNEQKEENENENDDEGNNSNNGTEYNGDYENINIDEIIEKLNEISYKNYHLVQTPEFDIDFKDLFTLENENIFLEDTDFKESEVIKTMDTANKDLTKAELSPVFLPTYETVFNAESENKILTDSF